MEKDLSDQALVLIDTYKLPGEAYFAIYQILKRLRERYKEKNLLESKAIAEWRRNNPALRQSSVTPKKEKKVQEPTFPPDPLMGLPMTAQYMLGEMDYQTYLDWMKKNYPAHYKTFMQKESEVSRAMEKLNWNQNPYPLNQTSQTPQLSNPHSQSSQGPNPTHPLDPIAS